MQRWREMSSADATPATRCDLCYDEHQIEERSFERFQKASFELF
jgi:hypothetical protein